MFKRDRVVELRSVRVESFSIADRKEPRAGESAKRFDRKRRWREGVAPLLAMDSMYASATGTRATRTWNSGATVPYHSPQSTEGSPWQVRKPRDSNGTSLAGRNCSIIDCEIHIPWCTTENWCKKTTRPWNGAVAEPCPCPWWREKGGKRSEWWEGCG